MNNTVLWIGTFEERKKRRISALNTLVLDTN